MSSFSSVWAAEDATDMVILKQLGTLRNEIQSLRKEVGQLREDFQRMAVSARPSPPPLPKNIEFSSANPWRLGIPGAKVGLVEFTDYQCPFCQRYHSHTFPKLKEVFIDSGKIQYITRDFPLGIHAEAEQAAIATRCAGRQGNFWEMRDGLFKNQERLKTELYEELATNLQLDLPTFLRCLQDSPEHAAVQADQSYGQTLGINGTPSFFIGRLEGETLVDLQRITGAQNFTMFSTIIDSYFKKSGEEDQLPSN